MRVVAKVIVITKTKKITFHYIESAKVMTSVNVLTDTAVVTLPRKLTWDIKKEIKRGDKIGIKFGYTHPCTVFVGYVKKVNTGLPLVIEAEDEMWKLKQQVVKPQRFDSLSMKQFCDNFLADYECVVNDFNFGEVIVSNETTVAGLLNYFKKNYPVNFFFKDGTFYGTLTGSQLLNNAKSNIIKIKYGINIVKENLKYLNKDDISLQIVAKVILKDNTKLEVKVPKSIDGATDVRTFFVPTAKAVKDLEAFAEQKIQEYTEAHVEGSVTLFGEPFVQKGDYLHYYNDVCSDLNDKIFFIESVNYTCGKGGIRQRCNLGMEVKR